MKKSSTILALFGVIILSTSCEESKEQGTESVNTPTYQLSGEIKTHGQLLDRICIDTNNNVICESSDISGEFKNDEYWFDVPENLSDGTLIIAELSNQITGYGSIMATTLFEGELITPVTTMTALVSLSNPSMTNEAIRHLIAADTQLKPNSAALMNSQYDNIELSTIYSKIERSLITLSACISTAKQFADETTFESEFLRSVYWSKTGTRFVDYFLDVFDWASQQDEITSTTFAEFVDFGEDEDSDHPCYFSDNLTGEDELTVYENYHRAIEKFSRVNFNDVVRMKVLNLGIGGDDPYSLVIEENGNFEADTNPYEVEALGADLWTEYSLPKESYGTEWIVDDGLLTRFTQTSKKIEVLTDGANQLNYLYKYYSEDNEVIEIPSEMMQSAVEIDISDKIIGNISKLNEVLSQNTEKAFLALESGNRFPIDSKAYVVTAYEINLNENPYYLEPSITQTSHDNYGETLSSVYSSLDQLIASNPILSSYGIQLVNEGEQKARLFEGGFYASFTGNEDIVCEIDWTKSSDNSIAFDPIDLENCNLTFSHLYHADDGKIYIDKIDHASKAPTTVIYLNHIATEAYLQ